MSERKQINFTIVPDDRGDLERTYANFCAISHTPFDFTLAFCEVLPLSEKDIQAAEADHVVNAMRPRDLHRAITATVIDDQHLDLVDAVDLLGKVRQRDR